MGHLTHYLTGLDDAADDAEDSSSQLLRRIRLFVLGKGGKVSTDSLMRAFKDELAANTANLFKHLLKEICRMTKTGSEVKWELKEAYK